MLGLRTSNSIECSDLEKNIPAHNQHNICFVVVDLSMLCQRSSWLVSLCRHAEDSSGLVLFLLECVASNQHRCQGEHSQDSDTILRCFLVVTKLHLKFVRAIRVNACSHIASAFWTYHLFRQLCLPCLASNVDSCGLICWWVMFVWDISWNECVEQMDFEVEESQCLQLLSLFSRNRENMQSGQWLRSDEWLCFV